jgi:hypothetical protein
MLSPQVTLDVVRSLIDRGERTGFIPTFFHGDHAAPFIAGSYLQGLRGYDIKKAYSLLLLLITYREGRETLRQMLVPGTYVRRVKPDDPSGNHPVVRTRCHGVARIGRVWLKSGIPFRCS